MKFILLILALTFCAMSDAQEVAVTLQQRAAAAAMSSDWPQALSLYTELTRSEPNNPSAWYQLGLATVNSGNSISDAIAAFNKARELGFAKGPALFAIARAYAFNEDHAATLKTLSELADIGPSRGILNRLRSDVAFDSLRNNPLFTEQFAKLQTRLTPCATAEYRQFDFWIGTWDVISPTKQPLGTNTVEAILDGCLVTESWESVGGSMGFSINYYDSATDTWTQTYRDNTGIISTWPNLIGGFRDGAMILENSDNPQSLSRWTWTKISDHKVRQMAENSADGGKNWQVVWDSFYVRVE